MVDNEELMECIRGDSVIDVHSGKDFKIPWKKKIHGKKYPLYWG